jgi:Phage endonuclease I
MVVHSRSLQEKTLRTIYPDLPYEKGKFHYVTTHDYTPDFWLGGNIYIECKMYIRYSDVAKYEAIAVSNPTLDLRFLINRCDKRTLDRLERTFKVAISDYIIPADWLRDGLSQGGPTQ